MLLKEEGLREDWIFWNLQKIKFYKFTFCLDTSVNIRQVLNFSVLVFDWHFFNEKES